MPVAAHFRATGLLALTLALLAWLPQEAGGLQNEPFALTVRPADGGVGVDLSAILWDGGIQRSLEAGLPVRIRLVTELWRDGFFDSQEGRHEWRATIRYDPLGHAFRVELADGAIHPAVSTEDAARVLQGALQVPLRPTRPGRYYYLGRMEVETLSLSDLEELQRWLRGEFVPSIGSPQGGSAVARGLRRLVVRVLGLPVQRFQARTPRFSWEAP